MGDNAEALADAELRIQSRSLSPEEAEAAYRAAWMAWLLTSDDDPKRCLERYMDSLQSSIAKGPKDPAWIRFSESLPGYLDFWGRWYRETLEGYGKKLD